jgi:hypothetical protein
MTSGLQVILVRLCIAIFPCVYRIGKLGIALSIYPLVWLFVVRLLLSVNNAEYRHYCCKQII